ncbi:MAG: hypothetical protein CM1200mP18_20430 [Gammaproteobacteria bacterium]|nr:MAG: hypothetical protein CM1200mP18_20430 [Gammaproteobacteria bacterium]
MGGLGWVPVAGLLYQGVVIAAGIYGLLIPDEALLTKFVSSFNFVSPISGVLVSMALLGDQLTVGIISVWCLWCRSVLGSNPLIGLRVDDIQGNILLLLR